MASFFRFSSIHVFSVPLPYPYPPGSCTRSIVSYFGRGVQCLGNRESSRFGKLIGIIMCKIQYVASRINFIYLAPVFLLSSRHFEIISLLAWSFLIFSSTQLFSVPLPYPYSPGSCTRSLVSVVGLGLQCVGNRESSRFGKLIGIIMCKIQYAL